MSGRPIEPEAPNPFRRPQRNVALRRSRRRRFVRRGMWGGVLLVVGGAAMTWIGASAVQWTTRTEWLALKAIDWQGVESADFERLAGSLSDLEGRNLLDIDLERTRRRLLADPWVADASVSRVFPATLAVHIEEERPAAVALLGGRLTLVAPDGLPIARWSARLGELDLPLLTGVEGPPEEAVSRIRRGLAALGALRRGHAAWAEGLSELDLSRKDRITARFTDERVPVWLDREEVTSNVDNYLAIRDDIARRVGAVQAIDLRWRGRVIVVPGEAEAESNG